MNEELRQLVIKTFHIEDFSFSHKTEIKDHHLSIRECIKDDLIKEASKIQEINIDLLKPHQFNKEINTIMDIVPISSKVLGQLGEGVTHTLTGIFVVLTGADATGKQLGEFGSSEGILEEQIIFGRPGTPKRNDLIIHFDVVLKEMDAFSREWVNVAFKKSDEFLQEIRKVMKELNGRACDEKYIYKDEINKKARKKVVLLKQVAGQGAMYDNILFPDEPSGFKGGHSIIDMKNMPILLSPNEYRDGALRSLT